MKKCMLMTVMILFTGMAGFTQAFEKGANAINLGIGFGNTYYHGNDYYGFFPSISGSYEHGIVRIPMGSEMTGVISIGGYLGWTASNYEQDWDDYYYRYSTVIVAVRSNYHFIFHDRFDPYAGVWIGGRINGGHWKGNGNHPDDWEPAKPSPAGGVYIGARWFFTENFAIYSELGYLISVFNIGVTFKF
jgi:hypothetical protein